MYSHAVPNRILAIRLRHALTGLVVASAFAVIACSPSPASAPRATSVPAGSPSAAAAPTGPTAGDLANQGKTVFAENCAKCHGDHGQGVTGPALIGPNTDLAKYKTAKGIFDFASSNMPQDNPGTLSSEQYLQVVSYLMVQNGDVKPTSPLSISSLNSVSVQH